jgi:hypothetical protein
MWHQDGRACWQAAERCMSWKSLHGVMVGLASHMVFEEHDARLACSILGGPRRVHTILDGIITLS